MIEVKQANRQLELKFRVCLLLKGAVKLQNIFPKFWAKKKNLLIIKECIEGELRPKQEMLGRMSIYLGISIYTKHCGWLRSFVTNMNHYYQGSYNWTTFIPAYVTHKCQERLITCLWVNSGVNSKILHDSKVIAHLISKTCVKWNNF